MQTSSMIRGVALAAVMALALGACSNKDEESKPTGVPPLANPPPATAPAPAAPPPAAPPAAAPAPAAPAPAAEPAKPADPNAKITGKVVLAPAMKKHVAPTDTIFIVARRVPDNPTARGTLVAVKKVSAEKLPLEFELSGADMPFGGSFDGELQLTVRVNKSGDPMMRRKGDVYGMLPKVKVGARNVKLPLDHLQTEDESLAQPGGNPHGGPMGGGGSLPPGHP
jgi:pyruvate/2-oxoglutarate dehydrogenase complex dihydrolipoamide acyltransferase (E2) component